MARDYFAEMYVAGLLADAGWNLYFPRRDKGFDYIITREPESGVLIRPVQVKGLYPTADKCDRYAYGYSGRLSVLHPQMALVLVYFPPGATEGTPQHIAYMPYGQIRTRKRGGYRCAPASLRDGLVAPRPKFKAYFDVPGLAAMGQAAWAEPGTAPHSAT
jgi:hypothetical protein